MWVSKDVEGRGLGSEGTSLLIRHFTGGIEENKSENGRGPNRNSNLKLLQGYCCTNLLISAFETSINNLTPGYVKKKYFPWKSLLLYAGTPTPRPT